MTERGPGRKGRAVVVRVDFGSCLLRPDSGPLVEATVRARLMDRSKSLGNALVVGDEVRYESGTGRALVTGIEPRRNAFSRRAPGDRPCEQVVASNLDQVVLVASVENPDFKAGFVDRVLAQCEYAQIPARMVINKLDLAAAGKAERLVDDYARAGYPAYPVSARSGEGIDAVRVACRGCRSLFVGHSGVGKSTLLNALVPGLELLVTRVNPKTGKGRHMTTAAWLIRADPDLELIDTPGVRAFGLWGIGPRELEQAYAEFRRHLGTCRFGDCRHDHEPGCAVKAAVEEGWIAGRRHQSFLKLRDELERQVAIP